MILFWYKKTKRGVGTLEKRIEELFWKVSDVIRGYHSQREMFDVFVALMYLNYISDKYHAEMRNGKINKTQLKIAGALKEELEILDYFESLPYFETFKKVDLEIILSELSNFNKANYISIIEKLLNIDHFEIGEVTTNIHLTKLSQKLLGEIDGSFADLCSGYGSFIIDTFHNKSIDLIDSYEINESNIFIQKALSTILNVESNVMRSNVLMEQIGKKYDYIFSAPPMGLRVQKQIVEQSIQESDSLISNYLRSNSSEWLFINKILGSLKDNGRAVVLVSNGTLFKTVDEPIRKTIIENGLLEGVINLSDGMLGKYTSIPISVLIFNRNQNDFIRSVDATNIFTKNRANKFLTSDNINEIIGMYYSDESIVKIKNLNQNDFVLLKSRYQFVGELEDFITISEIIKDLFRGVQISSRDYEKKIVKKGTEGSVNLLSLGNISEYFIDTNLETINPEGIRYERYILEDGDFIISAKGSKIKTAIFDSSLIPETTVPLGNVMVLRVNKDKYNPYFLKVFFSSGLGQKLLENAQTGSTIVSLNKKNLLELKIPRVSLEQQKKLVIDYLVSRDSYAYVLKEVGKKQQELELFLKDLSWE